MSRFRIAALALGVLLFFVGGCTGTQGGKNFWKSSGSFYNKHINKPAKLAFDDSTPMKPYQAKLIEAVSPVDFELEELIRAMDDSDRSPDEEWSTDLIKRFPWLGGVFIADPEGRVMLQTPAGQRVADFKSLLEPDPKQRLTDLRAAVLNGENTPLVYLAKPVYLKEDLRVLIVCWFDMRSLLARHGTPEKFIMLSGQNVFWLAGYNFAETPLANIDWEKRTIEEIDGRVKNEKGEFYWLASFFANIQFVYAIPVQGNFSVDTRQVEALKNLNFSGLGN